jgi:thiol-disulfide isomerase/thioredoxin
MLNRYIVSTLLFVVIFIPLKAQKKNIEKDGIRLSKVTKEIRAKIDSIIGLIQNNYKVISVTEDSVKKNHYLQTINDLESTAQKLRTDRMKIELGFAKKNPNSFLSLDILKLWFRRQEGISYTDTIMSIFNTLNNRVKKDEEGKEFILLITQFKKSRVGSKAPDFVALDMNNNQFSLAEFKNKKIILLDFWASWCGPCRADIPSLKKMHMNFNNKDFEIIGISEDIDPIKWKKAVSDDSTQIWKHILVSKVIKNNNFNTLLNDYFINGIPEKILINKDGVIIRRWKGGGEEHMKDINTILNEILK